jgi:hypothetical protein
MTLLELGEYLQNVSEACRRESGVSRQHFYDLREAYQSGGIEALREKNRRKPNTITRVAPDVEAEIVRLGQEQPAWGQVRVANELRTKGILISSGGVRCVPILRLLTDRGTEYCGRSDSHPFEVFLAMNDIEHTKTKAYHPQTNGIRERFHKTVLSEFHQVAFRRKFYLTLEDLQTDLDAFLVSYNTDRTHQGRICQGRTPILPGRMLPKRR